MTALGNCVVFVRSQNGTGNKEEGQSLNALCAVNIEFGIIMPTSKYVLLDILAT